MNETIPPSDEQGRGRLERKADALLEAAGEDEWDDWPDFWPHRGETEFDRIAADHTGVVPLMAVSLTASLPDFNPEREDDAIHDLMQERPGAEEPDPLSGILDQTTDGTAYGSGFTTERRNFPPDQCRWGGCKKPLYATMRPSKPGRPRKYCEDHQHAARARTQRLRRAGIRVGKNRNLVYDFDGLQEQELTGYRQIWGRINTARV